MKKSLNLLVSNVKPEKHRFRISSGIDKNVNRKPKRRRGRQRYAPDQLEDKPQVLETEESKYEDSIMTDKSVDADVFPSLYNRHISSLDLYGKTLKARMGYGVGQYLYDMHHKRVETSKIRYDLVYKNQSPSDDAENLKIVAEKLKDKYRTNSFKGSPINRRKDALNHYMYPMIRPLKNKLTTGEFTITPTANELLPDRIIKRKDKELYTKHGKYNSRLTKGTFLIMRDSILNETPIRARLVDYHSKPQLLVVAVGNILRRIHLNEFLPSAPTRPSATVEEDEMRWGAKKISEEQLIKVVTENLRYHQVNVLATTSDKVKGLLENPVKSFEELEELLHENLIQFKLEAYVKEDFNLLPETLKNAFLEAAKSVKEEDGHGIDFE